MRHVCGGCGFSYEFSDNQLAWRTYDTYCPQCTRSLDAQDLAQEIDRIMALGGREEAAKHIAIVNKAKTGITYLSRKNQ